MVERPDVAIKIMMGRVTFPHRAAQVIPPGWTAFVVTDSELNSTIFFAGYATWISGAVPPEH